MASCVGIEMGGGHASVAWFNPESRRALLIPLRSLGGECTVPMAFQLENGARPVALGHAALNARQLNPDSVVTGIPGLDALAELLRLLKRDAESYLDESVSSAVISLPAHVTTTVPIADAGRQVGLEIPIIVPHPCAAALGAQLANELNDAPRPCLVFHVSENACESSIVLFRTESDGPDKFPLPIIVASCMDEEIGTKSWAPPFAELVRKGIVDSHGDRDDIDPEAIERARQRLCGQLASVHVHDAAGRGAVVNRDEYLAACGPLVRRVRQLIRNVSGRYLAREGYRHSAGMDFIPLLVEDARWIPDIAGIIQEETGQAPVSPARPDRMIAAGAAWRAHLLATQSESASRRLE